MEHFMGRWRSALSGLVVEVTGWFDAGSTRYLEVSTDGCETFWTLEVTDAKHRIDSRLWEREV